MWSKVSKRSRGMHKCVAGFTVTLLLTIALHANTGQWFFLGEQRTVEVSSHEGNECQFFERSELILNESKIREKDYLAHLERVAQLPTEKSKRVPDIIGIGLDGCGTHALVNMLTKHPMIVASEPSELHFFDGKDNLLKTRKSYMDMMPEVATYQLSMEMTPSYFYGEIEDIARMMAYAPLAKLILLVCDPMDRTRYLHDKLLGDEAGSNYDSDIGGTALEMTRTLSSLGFDEGIQSQQVFHSMQLSQTHHILSESLYYFHFPKWLKFFSREQILVVDGGELNQSPWDVAREIEDFLGIPRLIIKADFARNVEAGSYEVASPTLTDQDDRKTVTPGRPVCWSLETKGRTRKNARKSTIKAVGEFYRPFNEKFFKLIGKRMAWQS